ncbi:hypothetical protein HY485_03355 [Candidatus Woesearchaeota archaeon]|nr:hypothetical protein [Candidatus Woesearchaeota archaeon]
MLELLLVAGLSIVLLGNYWQPSFGSGAVFSSERTRARLEATVKEEIAGLKTHLAQNQAGYDQSIANIAKEPCDAECMEKQLRGVITNYQDQKHAIGGMLEQDEKLLERLPFMSSDQLYRVWLSEGRIPRQVEW